MPLAVCTEDDVRRIAREVLADARPAFVSQRTVAAVVGLPARDFLRLARAGAFSVTAERRLRLARTADVEAWITSRAVRSHGPANDAADHDLDLALGRVGARRVG